MKGSSIAVALCVLAAGAAEAAGPRNGLLKGVVPALAARPAALVAPVVNRVAAPMAPALPGLPSQVGVIIANNNLGGFGNGTVLGASVASGSFTGNGGLAGLGVASGSFAGNGGQVGAAVLSGPESGNGGVVGIGVMNAGQPKVRVTVQGQELVGL